MGKQSIVKRKPKSAKRSKPAKPKSVHKKRGNVFDAFAKQMFGRLVIIIDFLMSYADVDFIEAIDLSKIRLAPTHYIGQHGDERIVDLVFQCPLKNGNGSLMAVIIFEHQGGNLKEIPQKLHKYISAIWDAEKKEGKKVLSAPYFIILRTGKRPHRGPPPTMADSLPKGRDGKPLGHVPEIRYKVVDLPGWDFRKLVGGPTLRLVMGVLQTMTVGNEENLPEAFLPLREIPDGRQKVELTQELLDFVDKAMKAHNRRLDAAMVSKILKPAFRDEEQAMIKSIFDEKFDAGVAVGEARGDAKVAGAKAETGRNMLLMFLRARFGRVPKGTEKAIRQMTDPIALESLAAHVGDCASLDEFATALK